MLKDLKFALQQLRQPFVLFALAVSFALTLALFMGASRLVFWAITHSQWITTDWVETAAGYAGSGLMLVLGLFLFPITMSAISCLFLDAIATRIERRHFPDLPAGTPSDWADDLVITFKVLWRTL